jgi:hypothetical protein
MRSLGSHPLNVTPNNTTFKKFTSLVLVLLLLPLLVDIFIPAPTARASSAAPPPAKPTIATKTPASPPITATTFTSTAPTSPIARPLSTPTPNSAKALKANSALNSAWQEADIGNVGIPATSSYANGTFTVQSSGSDIWNNTDGFHFVYQPFYGDGSLITHLTSLNAANACAKAGLMLRDSLDPSSAQVSVVMVPGCGGHTSFTLYRSGLGAGSNVAAATDNQIPVWLKLERKSNQFNSYTSTDGASWNLVGSVSLTMAYQLYIGLVVSSHDTGIVDTATFDNVNVSDSDTAPAPLALEPQWSYGDIGSVGTAGSVSYGINTDYSNPTNKVYSLRGSGSDIWNNADGFSFLSQALVGDGSLIARVRGLSNTNGCAKAGLMLRDSLDPSSAEVSVVTMPNCWGYTTTLLYRSGLGAGSNVGATSSAQIPCWLKLERVGSQFNSYVSSDGANWSQVGSVSFTMASQIYIGLVVSSHDTGIVDTASFDNVEVNGSGVVPASLRVVGGDGQSANLNTTFNTALQVKITDANGNPLSGVRVQFTAPTDNIVVDAATNKGSSKSTTKPSSGKSSRPTPTKGVVGGAGVPVSSDGEVASGIFADSGTNVTTATTDANGIATAAAFSANGLMGNYVVTASVNGLVSTASFNLTNAGPPASIELWSPSNNQAAALNSNYVEPFVVFVTDANGNAVPNTNVTFTIIPGAVPSGDYASGTFAGNLTSVKVSTGTQQCLIPTDKTTCGEAFTPSLTANNIAGSLSIEAQVDGLSPVFFDLQNFTPHAAPTTSSYSLYVANTWSNLASDGNSNAYHYGYSASVGDLATIILAFGRQSKDPPNGAYTGWGVRLTLPDGNFRSNTWVSQVAQDFINGYSANPAHTQVATIAIGTSNDDDGWICNEGGQVDSRWAEAGSQWGQLVTALNSPSKVIVVGANDIENWPDPDPPAWYACGAGTENWLNSYNVASSSTTLIDFGNIAAVLGLDTDSNGNTVVKSVDSNWTPFEVYAATYKDAVISYPEIYCGSYIEPNDPVDHLVVGRDQLGQERGWRYLLLWASDPNNNRTILYNGVTSGDGGPGPSNGISCNGTGSTLTALAAWNELNNILYSHNYTLDLRGSLTSFAK